jgi:hypothetical protein
LIGSIIFPSDFDIFCQLTVKNQVVKILFGFGKSTAWHIAGQ